MGQAVKFALIMMLVGLVAAILLVGVRLFTQPRIEVHQRMEKQEALSVVLPEAEAFEAVQKEGRIIYHRGYASPRKEKVVGYAFLASGRGFSSVIRTLVGMSPDGKITGIKILCQRETPGLGARIEEIKTKKTLASTVISFFRRETLIEEEELRPWFQEQFSGKELKNLQVVREEEVGDKIQAITGATISSEAVTDSVREKAKEILALIRSQKSESRIKCLVHCNPNFCQMQLE